MRLLYGDSSAIERAQRERISSAALLAWSELARGDVAGACSIIERIDARLEMRVTELLDGVACVELVPLQVEAWPLAELCLSLSPSDAPYVLALGRAAVPLSRALEEVRASHDVSLERSTLRAGFGRGHLLELTLGVPGGSGSENEQNAAENLVRAVLGDRLFETWIGAVHVTAAPRGGPLRVLDIAAPRGALTLGELFDTVSAAAVGVLEGLSESAVTERGDSRKSVVRVDRAHDADDDALARGDWTMLEVEPLLDDSPKRDLVLATTCTPELLRCYLDGAPCSSRRFSARGERFVFVSYADARRTMDERVARRTLIESALAASLQGVGRITGVGFGVETSYVDVGLLNLEAGLERLVSKLRQLDAPADTFIHFFDSELAEEWLSIWPDTRLTES